MPNGSPSVAVAVAIALVGCTRASPSAAPGSALETQAAPEPVSEAKRTNARVVITTPRGDVGVHVEVVKSWTYLEQGLMYRTAMAADDGMLFLMGEERDWTFWMKNTLIPLDMIFITKDMTVAGVVQNAEPQTLKLRAVGALSLYVLEVNGGYAASHGVFAGERVRFENTDAAAK